MVQLKHFLLCLKNHWDYENKRCMYHWKTLWNWYQKWRKKLSVLEPFLKKQCFGKMGVAGTKRGPHPSNICPFLGKPYWKFHSKILTGINFQKHIWAQSFIKAMLDVRLLYLLLCSIVQWQVVSSNSIHRPQSFLYLNMDFANW